MVGRLFTEWTPEDYSDLDLCAEIGDTVQIAAAFLNVSEDEVRRVAKERGLVLKDEPVSNQR